MQETIRGQGILLEGNIFSPTNDGDLLGVGHQPLSHTQSMGTDMPQNYLAAQGNNTYTIVSVIDAYFPYGYLIICLHHCLYKYMTPQI